MRKPYKKIPKSKSVAAIVCPDCGSEDTRRVQRNFLEKVISVLTFETVAYHKYYCKICDKYILKGKGSAASAERFHEDKNTSLAGDYNDD